jgi:hypothetical protein
MPTVDSPEFLSRFVTSSRWIRADQTVKPDAFIPYPYPDLSVTRHKNNSESQIWEVGKKIVNSRPEPPTLYGRADLTAGEVRKAKLEVEAQPDQTNPNHAVIIGWPTDKPSQKIRAQELAVVARFRPTP